MPANTALEPIRHMKARVAAPVRATELAISDHRFRIDDLRPRGTTGSGVCQVVQATDAESSGLFWVRSFLPCGGHADSKRVVLQVASPFGVRFGFVFEHFY